MKCDGKGCNKELIYKTKNTELGCIGMQVLVTDENKTTNEYTKALKKSMGKYKLGKTYNLCWECLLKHSGFKP